MLSELDILRDVSMKLEDAGIPFMLTGSMAMNHYAQPRMTRDIDIVIALPPSRSLTIGELFRPEYYVADEAIAEALRYESMFNIIHVTCVIKVDFIIRKRADYRVEEFERRQWIKIDGFHTWVVSREDLILSKLDWMRISGSEMQRRDIANLLSDDCDMSYMLHWAGRLNLTERLQEILDERHKS